jgi:hypothetical protein
MCVAVRRGSTQRAGSGATRDDTTIDKAIWGERGKQIVRQTGVPLRGRGQLTFTTMLVARK